MGKILGKKSKDFIEKIQNAPLQPGCYLYIDEHGKVVYVGKAKVLKNRLNSYFTGYDKLDAAKQQMIDQITNVITYTVDSEVEALILENNLIKKYRPKYNIMMKDDKSYIYVRFEKIRRKSDPIPDNDSTYQDFPRITLTREKKNDGAEYFGPYPDSMPAKRILRRLRRLFPVRSTNNIVYVESTNPEKIYSSTTKRCFYCNIGLCNGACAGQISKAEYIKSFKSFRNFFRGEKQEIINELEKEMKKASAGQDYEEAARIRDKINDIKYITAHISIDKDVDDTVVEQIKRQERKGALEELILNLKFPSEKISIHKDFKIECYDISNIQGTNAVGSMVVMVDGAAQPQLYRRFRIRMKNEPNDFAMLQEVLGRRFKRFSLENQEDFDGKKDPSFSILPDLIIIDGGKGQLASTYKVLYTLGLHNTLPIVGLAKREEEIFKLTDQFKDENFNQINDSKMFTRIKLPRRSQSLYLVQRIRDEAHRFAITYHRKLRSKKMLVEGNS